MLPCSWRIFGFFSISDTKKISPSVYLSPKIVKFFRSYENFSWISSAYPTIIDCIEFSINSLYSGEIFIHKWIWVVKCSIAIIKIIISNTLNCIFKNLWYPLAFNYLFPLLVKSCNSLSKITFLISKIELNPCFYLFHCNSWWLTSGDCTSCFEEIKNSLNRIFSKDIFRWLSCWDKRKH